ncbi:MAG: hypothetical protein KTV68_18890 [Acidimicrobiia bacterium]|nr:hypothetical protein [Acidimicrobiia bacterium]MCY4486841.1 hypothetical protein [Deltaproteobacteria bacterium]
MTSNDQFLPELTAEALVTLAAVSGVPPAPLVLSQLGFADASEIEPRWILEVVDRGARTLKSLQDFTPSNPQWSEMLRQSILGMGNSRGFIILIRSDQQEVRVVYLGEEHVIDAVTPYGNHRLCVSKNAVEEELGLFFGDCPDSDKYMINCHLERFGSGATAAVGEDPVVSRLASETAVDHMATVCRTSEVVFEILKWRSVDNQLFVVSNQDNQVSFRSSGSREGIETVLSAIQRIQQGQ